MFGTIASRIVLSRIDYVRPLEYAQTSLNRQIGSFYGFRISRQEAKLWLGQPTVGRPYTASQ